MAEVPQMEMRARVSADTAQFTRGMQQASQAVEGFSKTTGRLNSAMIGLGVVAGGAGAAMIAFGIKSFNAAARVDELNYAIDAIGKSTGLGGQALADEALEVKNMGIEMEIAQKSVLKFAQNNLELGKASDLARIAQDLAIISGENSTDTFNKLTHAVITGRSEVLKSVGIQENAGQMYAKFAKSIGKTTKQLSYQEKQQAVLQGVMAEGVKVFGTYEAAMKSPGKTLRSFARLHNELQVAMGNVLLKAFGPIILAAYDLEKAITKAVEKNKTFQAVLGALQAVFTKLTQPITDFITKITDAVKGFDTVYTSADNARKGLKKVIPDTKALAEKFEMLLPPIAAATAGLATFAGRGLLQNLPIIGNVLSKLKVFPVMMVVLALTSTQVRKALVNLFTAFKPLVPVIVQIGKVMGTASVIGVAVLAKAINILAAIVRGVIGFVQRNIELFKILGGVVAFVALTYGGYRLAILLAMGAQIAYTAVMGFAATATAALRTAVAMLNMTMLLNPIPLVIGLVIALITAFGYLMATNEDFRQVVKKVFNFVLKVIIYVFASIVSAIGMWIQGIAFLIRVFGFFVEAVVKVFETVLDIILTVISSVLKGFRFLIDGFVSLMESQGIFYDVVKFVFNAVIKIITLVISGIINIFARLVGGVADLLGVFNFLFKGVRSIFLSILDAISGVGNGIFKILENVASGIGKFLGQVFDAVTGWVRNLLSLFSKIPGIGPLVANALNAGLDATKKAITGIASLGVDLGKSVFNGVVNGVKATVNGISNIGTSTENTLRKVETTLSKFSAKVVEFGKEDNGAKMISLLVKGAKGASSGLTTVLDAIQKVIDAPLSNTVGDFIDGIAGKVDKAGEMVMGLAATMMEFADKTDFAGIVGDKIGGFIDKIKESLKEGLGFGDILAEEKKKYTDATKKDDGTQAAEDAETMANRLKTIREAMQAGIESIKGVLDDLQQAAQDFAESLKDTIVGFAGLKGVELPDGFIPKAKSLIENMGKRLDKSKEFAGQIYKLQNMGLDADALKAIIEEGPIKGAQLAASILGGGQSAIDEISRLQKEIQFTGAVIGEYGARVGFDQKIATASTQLRDLQNASLSTSSSGSQTFIEQGAFQVYVDTAGATNEEERASIITKRIEETFATLARQLASK
ncbi:tail tape measure protein [Freshwater phage uvFW-CGR-AMD-COM-C203]|nr:tail tape measure protein [Freshwater phage uvFW-CGR-AMD-COM-C203]